MYLRWIAVILFIISLPIVFLFGFRAFVYYPVWQAKRKAIPVTPQLVAEARAILRESETTDTYVWWNVAGNVPPVMQTVDPDAVIQVRRGGEAVNMQVRGGHVHGGLIIIPDPETFDYTHLKEDEDHKRINDHLWEYMF